MYDTDGPVFAKAVYRAFLAQSDVSAQLAKVSKVDLLNYMEDAYRSVRPLQENEVATLREGWKQYFIARLSNSSLTREGLVEVTREGLTSISTGPVLDSEVEAIVNVVIRETVAPSLAHYVDEITRDLRVRRRLPAVRWATFVHVGA